MFVVGDLTHDEAHTYFFNHMLPLRKHLPDAEHAWKRVFEVCGGNPGLLKKCALEATKSGCWESGAVACTRCFVSVLTFASRMQYGRENGHAGHIQGFAT